MTPKQKNLIFIVLILGIMLFYIFSGGSVGISLDFAEEALALSAADHDWTIPYDRIRSLELEALPNLGTCIEGSEKSALCYGTWKNDRWNEYTLCIDPNIDQCIIVTMDNADVYVFNYENSESTRQLHKMFTELLQSKHLPAADQDS